VGRVEAATIDLARAGDVPELSQLAARTWSRAFGASVDPEDEAAELADTRSEAFFREALRTCTILVARDGHGALLGYAQLGDVDIPEVEARPGDAALQRLYVDTGLQGRGLGRALLEAALRHPRLAEASRVFLTVWEQNERAVRLYEHAGFRRVGTTRFTIGSQEAEDLVMLRERGGPP
jgi:ribosomal protein S18 acetylase RimI-like enzyme